MINSTFIATTGVAILLIAFFLNLVGVMKQTTWIYLIMNFAGALLSCYASYLIQFLLFVILEATWAVAAIIGCFRKLYLINKVPVN